MEFRKSTKEDLKEIMEIIKQAQSYFKSQGIDQWQNNYPNERVINNDILNGESYVLVMDDKVVGTTVVSFKPEKTYESIVDGKWLTKGEYGVIHRIAIDNRYKGTGFAHKIIKYVEELCISKDIKSIKVDTHEDNIVMQSLLNKNNFKYCGVVYLEDGGKRLAFEKNIILD